MSTRRVPPNIFAIPFGLAGLAEAWEQAQRILHTPAGIPDAITIVAAAAWIVLIGLYAQPAG